MKRISCESSQENIQQRYFYVLLKYCASCNELRGCIHTPIDTHLNITSQIMKIDSSIEWAP